MSGVHREAIISRRAMQREIELIYFGHWLLTRDPPVKRVLEIGSAYGGMLWWFRMLLQPELLVSIDLEFPQPLADLAIRGDSTAVNVRAQISALAPFDLVFLDGAGSPDSVDSDWRAYASQTRILALHDIRGGKLEALWPRLHDGHEHVEFIDRTLESYSGYGIGACVLR